MAQAVGVTRLSSNLPLIRVMLHDQYKLDLVAPGHCTGEPEFAALKKTTCTRELDQ
jgi:hypothetical protein